MQKLWLRLQWMKVNALERAIRQSQVKITQSHTGSEQDWCYGLWPVVLFLCQHILLPSPAEPHFCPLSQQCAIHGQKTTAHPHCSPLIYASATWRSLL